MLNRCGFRCFNQIGFDTPLPLHFIHRTETFMTIHTAGVEFRHSVVEVTLSGRQEMANNDRRVLRLEIACKPLDWQLSAITQVLNSFSSSLPALESRVYQNIGRAKSRSPNGEIFYTHYLCE